MKISVIGTGYVGLVSGICLAEKGHQVICVDQLSTKIDQINQGISPIYERGLNELLTKNIHRNLSATTDLNAAIQHSDISLIAVGTPFNEETQAIDLQYIEAVSQAIGGCLRHKSSYHLVVVKSTVVPGTTDEVVLPALEQSSGKQAGQDFGVGMNPEFLREGNAVEDFMSPDRIVFGGMDKKSTDLLFELYSVFKGVDKIATNNKTAEMIKYASNSLLATLISFSNEIANLCVAIGGIDVTEVTGAMHLDKRISPILATGERITPHVTTYLEAGCGFGGSCFPKDVKALIAYGEKAATPMPLLDAVMTINAQQPYQLIKLLKKHFPELANLKVALLGLAFKPDTDDVRESPTLPIAQTLIESQAQIKLFDPIFKHLPDFLSQMNITLCQSLEDVITDVDAILLITRWPIFEQLPELLAKLPNPPLVIDGRRMLNKNTISRYEGIGLGKS